MVAEVVRPAPNVSQALPANLQQLRLSLGGFVTSSGGKGGMPPRQGTQFISARFVVILNALLLWGQVSQIPVEVHEGSIADFQPVCRIVKAAARDAKAMTVISATVRHRHRYRTL